MGLSLATILTTACSMFLGLSLATFSGHHFLWEGGAACLQRKQFSWPVLLAFLICLSAASHCLSRKSRNELCDGICHSTHAYRREPYFLSIVPLFGCCSLLVMMWHDMRLLETMAGHSRWLPTTRVAAALLSATHDAETQRHNERIRIIRA